MQFREEKTTFLRAPSHNSDHEFAVARELDEGLKAKTRGQTIGRFPECAQTVWDGGSGRLVIQVAPWSRWDM
jgi:hypothetical protein